MAVGVHVSTRDKVRECLAVATDRADAVQNLLVAVERDSSLRKELLATYWPDADFRLCELAIRSEANVVRSRHTSSVDVEGLVQKISGLTRRIELWTLEGSGIKLLSATKEEVQGAQDWHRGQVLGHERDIAFYGKVLKPLKRGEAVSLRWSVEGLADALADGDTQA